MCFMYDPAWIDFATYHDIVVQKKLISLVDVEKKSLELEKEIFTGITITVWCY